MFIFSCNIKKDTQELRDKLKKLGIMPRQCIIPKYFPYLFISKGFYSRNEIGPQEDIDNVIDCGANEELCLAIAAIRDDTDKNQWLTNGQDNFWCICGEEDATPIIQYYKENYQWDVHKATVQELIDHFK